MSRQPLSALIVPLMQHGRFQNMSNTITGKIDEMGSRIDDLERQVGELVQSAGDGRDR